MPDIDPPTNVVPFIAPKRGVPDDASTRLLAAQLLDKEKHRLDELLKDPPPSPPIEDEGWWKNHAEACAPRVVATAEHLWEEYEDALSPKGHTKQAFIDNVGYSIFSSLGCPHPLIPDLDPLNG